MSAGPGMSRPGGFTLLETILASTIASLLLLAALSMFLTIARSETTLAARFDQTNEMAQLQLTTRRAMLSLVMGENSLLDEDGGWAVPDGESLPPRGRMLLMADPTAEAYAATGRWARPLGAGQIQRFEVVLDAPPVPDALLGPAAGWATRAPADAMDFSLADMAGEDTGGVRGAFELRPDGVREGLMRSVGLAGRDWPVRGEDDPRAGWTLWWREYSLAEIAHLAAGGAPLPDDVTTPEGQERLLRAYPLVRGVDEILWQVFYPDERQVAHAALATKELPGYVELEIGTTTGQYANWMFEMGWRVAADPTDEDDTDAPDGDDEQIAGDAPGGGRNFNGGGGGGRSLRGVDFRSVDREEGARGARRQPRPPRGGDE